MSNQKVVDYLMERVYAKTYASDSFYWRESEYLYNRLSLEEQLEADAIIFLFESLCGWFEDGFYEWEHHTY